MTRAIIAAVAATALVFGAVQASASVCGALTEDSLGPGDVVVVAKLTRIEVLPGQEGDLQPETIAHIRVDEVIRGERLIRKRHLTVRDPCWNAACGISGPVGRRYGFLLHRRGGLWRASPCTQTEPREIRALFDRRN